MSKNLKLTKEQAIEQLWRKGELIWKCHPVQKEMHKLFYESPENSTLTWLLSRQSGKSYLLAILALEQCLKEKNSIVKLLTDTKVHVKTIFEPIFRELTEDCPDDLKPVFNKSEYTYAFPNGSVIQLAGSDGGHYERLRGQRCLGENTEVLTPIGPVKIKDIKPGDVVYGYNNDDTVTPTKVLNKFDQGVQTVTSIYRKGKHLLNATENHRFLSASQSSIFSHKSPALKIRHLKDIHEDNTRIYRKHVNIPCGFINEPHAYAIGAMLGDGCKNKAKNGFLHISSFDNKIPNKVAETIGCDAHSDPATQYRWIIKNKGVGKYKHSKTVWINYDHWFKHITAPHKTFDYDIVNEWDRESCLNLVAGLIDTDGSIYCDLKTNTLELRLTTTSEKLKDNFAKLIYKIWQVKPRFKKRKWDKKSKHQAYDIRIRSSYQVKRILKELSPYLVIDYKKYQPHYDLIHSKETENHIKIEKREQFEEQTYDLEVDNDTHLFLTADGLVTHNSNLVLVDEAGFCDNLYDVVKSVLLPTLTHTGGKIVLASTPPQDPDHEFYGFIEEAEMNGFLTKKTIYQNPLLAQQQIDRIIKEMGGVQSPKFKREYLVETIREEENVIFPEFDEKLEKEIVKEWVKPPFYNCYVGMDLGYKDLTAVLFVYYDFRNDKVVVEDEIVLQGKDVILPKLAQDILKKEEILWTDPLTNETRKPAARVSDINYLVTQELARITYGKLSFATPNKDDNNAAINNLRVLLANKKIIINPRCKNLIRHLKNCKWKDGTTKQTFARSPDNGHYDTVDALKYVVRSVGFNKNPYPKHYNLDINNMHVNNPAAFRNPTYNQSHSNSTTVNIYKKIFGKR